MPRRIVIFDTTLRDGEQSPGASMNIEEKFTLALQLARLQVDVIEAGFPISSPGDFEAVRLIAERVGGPTIAGLARALPADIDRAWEALRVGKRGRIHTFISTSDIHLQHQFKRSREQILEMAVAAVKQAKGYLEDVEFSAMDASRTDIDYLCQVVQAVIEVGATTVNIPDTVGYAQPAEFGAMIRALVERVPNIGKAVISVHCHNDLGLAVANSLAAVANGAGQVECTVNGIGERAGNAALEEVVMTLRTRPDAFGGADTGINSREIYRTSRLVSDITGIAVQPNKAIVGSNAFAHESGIHQHGLLKHRSTYEIMEAASVGVGESRLVLGKHSGSHAFESKLREMGIELEPDQLQRTFARFKDLADKKKEISDRDIEAIVADETQVVHETFHLDYMHVVGGSGIMPTATVRLLREGEPISLAATGVGSVDAIYTTIDRLVKIPHRLVDYNVKSVTGGTDALGEVTVRLTDDSGQVYLGRGSSTDILDASAKAYVHAINRLAHDHATRAGRVTPEEAEARAEAKPRRRSRK